MAAGVLVFVGDGVKQRPELRLGFRPDAPFANEPVEPASDGGQDVLGIEQPLHGLGEFGADTTPQAITVPCDEFRGGVTVSPAHAGEQVGDRGRSGLAVAGTGLSFAHAHRSGPRAEVDPGLCRPPGPDAGATKV